MVHRIDALDNTLLCFSLGMCHSIGSRVQAGRCGAIVSHCRSQWNLTLDRARVCCQELNLIDPPKLFSVKSYKERALTSRLCKLDIKPNINSLFTLSSGGLLVEVCCVFLGAGLDRLVSHTILFDIG